MRVNVNVRFIGEILYYRDIVLNPVAIKFVEWEGEEGGLYDDENKWWKGDKDMLLTGHSVVAED